MHRLFYRAVQPRRSPRTTLSRAAAGIGLAVGLILPAASYAQVYRPVLNFPAFPGSQSSSNQLLGVAASSNIYVTTYRDTSAPNAPASYNAVEMFTPGGQLTGSFGGSGSGAGQLGQSSFPGTVASFGANVYVADAGNNRVEVFDAAGAYVSQFSVGGNSIHSLAVNSGSIYATDQQNNVVRIFNKNGSLVSQFGGLGSGAGQFGSSAPNGPSDPISLAANDSRVYVSDPVNHRVEIFDTSGSFLSQFSGPLFSGNLYFPGVVATNATNVFVSQGNLVQVFDLNGSYRTQFGAVELGSIAVSGTTVYTTDVLGRNVIVFDVPEPGGVALGCGLSVWGLSLLRQRRRRAASRVSRR